MKPQQYRMEQETSGGVYKKCVTFKLCGEEGLTLREERELSPFQFGALCIYIYHKHYFIHVKFIKMYKEEA